MVQAASLAGQSTAKEHKMAVQKHRIAVQKYRILDRGSDWDMGWCWAANASEAILKFHKRFREYQLHELSAELYDREFLL